ncbi:hypothetical protein LSCM1_08233 [Leishmania martiniquensis]|uniref:Conserved oligomeric Golgi complex subunit 1 n=1 Tax=Leishmania martiniquensis TaxID=1580590 RepID=A0A836I4R2_9TRYP|nr:hypothetical protein LSCM1_08233 [Leishmania martiniquensis]
MEEAAQEVRRILRQNDVEESLHYLSTVTRSIEANQHDLRAIIGNSYRDLLNACDGVVGMERDCADILAIEEAMERVAAAQDVDGRGNTEMDAEPLLPSSWFSARRRRRRCVVAAASTTTTISTNSASIAAPLRRSVTKGYTANSGGVWEKGGCDAESAAAAAKEGYGASVKRPDVHPMPALPIVELPFPYVMPAHASHAGTSCNALVDEGMSTSAAEAQRMWLEDELQALHLDCMSLASAAAAMAAGAANAVDAELRSLLANSSTLASLPLRARQCDKVLKSHDAHQTVNAAKGTAASDAVSRKKREDILCSLERDLPLLRLARRLSRVQASLRVYAGVNDVVKASTSAGDASTASSDVLARLGAQRTSVAKRPPLWVADLERRATTLEVRLVKLILQRLRRAADNYACLAEKRGRLAQRMSREPSGTEVTESSREAQAIRAAESRCLVYVWVIFAQCHGAVRALRDSPTLVSALAACAPGAALSPKRALLPAVQVTEPAASTAAHIPLDSAANALLQLASGDVQAIVLRVMYEGTPLASADVGHTAVDKIIPPRAADPCRTLLAFLAVLLLRESQLNAMRWGAMTPSCLRASSPSAAAQPPSPLPDGCAGDRSIVAAASRKSNGSTAEGDAAPSLPSTAPRNASVFATDTHLMALGVATAAADRPQTAKSTRAAAGNGMPNTAWALRCFSGLSYLLRAFADYIDLVRAASVEASSAPEALDEETAVLRLLQHVCLADEATSGDHLWVSDHCAGVGAATRQGGEESLLTTPANVAGVRSLEELMEWRLRNASRCVLPSDAAGDSGGTSITSPTATEARTVPPLVASDGSLMTPVRDLYSFSVAQVAPGVTSPSAAVARRRAYVELLRASVNTVDALQASGASSATVREYLYSACADSAGRRGTPAASGAADLLSPLRLVCQELLAPCVSSLVVLLARDPVALAAYKEGHRSSDTTPARHAVRDALRRLLHHRVGHSSQSGISDGEAPLSFSGLGQTWTAVDAARWWEVMEQSTVDAALERCVAVALDSVGFVDACISQGLVASALRMLQGREEVSSTALGHGVSSPHVRGPVYHSSTAAASLEQTWLALCSVLRLHALSSGDSFSRADEAGTFSGTEGENDAKTEQGSAQSLTGSPPSLPGGGNGGRGAHRGSHLSAMIGICWDRFWPRTATETDDRTHRSLRPSVGEGIFCEEGLEWGRAACRAAQLPFSAMCGATYTKESEQPQQALHAAAASAGLSASQQAEIAKILSGMRDVLFPRWEASCSHAEHDTASLPEPGPLHMNGHAAELLHCCLSTLVDAVQAQTAAVPISVSDSCAVSLPSTPPPPLRMRIVGWLEDALHRAAAQLRNAKTDATPSGINATVVHSYELSLLLRVYLVVLQRLQMAALPSEAARVRQLCAEAEDLYKRAQAPWQDMLIHFYRAALQQAYAPLPWACESGEEESGRSAASRRSGAVLRRTTYVVDSAAWMRVRMVGEAALHDDCASESGGVAYPARPTPAVMTLTQTVMRHLHQALYGAPSVFTDSSESLMTFEPPTGAPAGVATASGHEQGATASAAALGRLSSASGCCMCALVTKKEQQQVRARLAEASAAFYESELGRLINSARESGGGAPPEVACGLQKGRGAAAANAATVATQSQADDVRLQWYMDVLFTSSVWCAGREDAGDGDRSGDLCGNSAGLLSRGADSPAKTLFSSDAGIGGAGVDAAACVADGPLRRVVRHLESTCDPVRWRSGTPLVIAAYRQFISASALLWVVRSEAPRHASSGDTGSGDSCRGPSVAAAAASKSFAVAGGVDAAALPTERLFRPREQVDRLALLPIAVSSNAAIAAAASMGAGGAPSTAAALAPQSYPPLPPTASALNPPPPSPASATGVPPTASFRFGSPSSAVAAATGGGWGARMPSFIYPATGVYDGAATWMLGGVGAAGVASEGGAAAPAGSISAVAAASSLWGTTQRGWNQLWGTS